MSTPPPVELEQLNAAFSEKCSKSYNVCFNNSSIYEAGFQAKKEKNEDKTVFFEFKLGLMVALFDGHHSEELSEYASQTLPAFLCARIETTLAERSCSLGDAVTESFIKGIEDYDRSLLQDGVINEFPQKDQTDWSDLKWQNQDEVWLVLGWLREHPKFQRARYAVAGTTALIAFIDNAKENIWVASLGDSDAFLGRKKDTLIWDVTRLSDFHNGSNPKEVERLKAEHPGEPPIIRHGRVLSDLAVTRALGNHQLKTPLPFARYILGAIWPTPFIPEFFDEEVVKLGHTNPPYISATPTVCHHSLKPGDVLVLSSDGLAYELREFSEEDKLLAVVSLATATTMTSLPQRSTVWSEKLRHGFIASAEGDNPAEYLIKNVCFGTNLEQMAEVVKPLRRRDDISALILFL
ncbi:phosphatase 2C-like domain-containing protein [Rhodocollybia butyracea]|uniref:Phosphatase 2C-like domain-containing protein n=1 Tax=Rhodocollybia butyracea TaxID=206335 RepID=A0A9P5U3G9_9AGAR|nr:phosphatase 2C-like domain-containing protein [Rhodocollybia butyracea]